MQSVSINSFLKKSVSLTRMENIPDPFSVAGLSIDSRTIRPNEVFIAIKGERFDGHHFVNEAIQKGAKAVVIQENSLKEFSKPEIGKIWVDNTIHFLMEFAGWYRSQFDIPVIGLTGSTGKTTTKEMLAAILEREFDVEKTQKNMNNYIGVSLSLLQISSKTQKAVIELGTNCPGEIARLTEMTQPTHAAITNIGHGHVGFFGSLDNIYKEKSQLFTLMKEGSTAFLNMEDSYISNFESSDLHLIRFGLSSDYDYQGKLIGTDDWGRVKFSVNGGPKIQLQIPGKQQFMNGLLAASIALEMGITMENVKFGLESVKSSQQRMEMFQYEGILFINDAYNSNPESLKAAIDFLYDLPKRNTAKKFLILGDMLELGKQSEQEHRRIGEYLNKKSLDFVFCFGEKCKYIIEVIKNKSNGKMTHAWFQDHKDIANAIKPYLSAGDIVLIKGSRGMTMENVLIYLGVGRA